MSFLVPKFCPMKECKHEFTNDFSYFESWDSDERIEHIYCPACKTHWWKGKVWSAEEWEEYVNGETK